ncbi:MAG TPA: hypothetical protein DEP00_03355 [Lachnospiraceae bacterium]|nr:hypothetical protein [Lachnospiraceae bacterium]
MKDLSEKQQAIMNFMKEYQDKNGFSPSIREICDAVGLKSTSTVHGHLNRLEEKGYIKHDPAIPRSFVICRQPEKTVEESVRVRTKVPGTVRTSQVEQTVYPSSPQLPELVAVPIVGKVRAGEPILAVQNIEDYFPVPVEQTHNSDCFMLRVQGESMINAGIYEGDLILVRQQHSANNRDIVVALLGDSVTVKTFYRENDYIRLQPENDLLTPILIKDCVILGKVIGLFRSIR